MVHSYIYFKKGARVRETMTRQYAKGTVTVPTNSPSPHWLDLDYDMVHITWDTGGSGWVPFMTVEVI